MAIVLGTAPVTGKVFSITGPGVTEGLRTTITPFHRPPSTISPTPIASDFASTAIRGRQTTITITFDKDVDFIEVTAKNSLVSGNKIIVYDSGGNKLTEVAFGKGFQFNIFGSKRTFGQFNSTKRIEHANIRRVELIPSDDEEFIFWGGLRVRKQDESVSTEEILDGRGRIIRARTTIPFQVRLISTPSDRQISLEMLFEIKPAIPVFTPDPMANEVNLTVIPMPFEIEQAIIDISRELTLDIVDDFFDDDRVLKTLLNFGNDFQSLVINWQRDLENLKDQAILVRLYKPLPIEFTIKTLVWISRELSPTWTDNVSVIVTPEDQVIFFLRPPNKSSEVTQLFGKEVTNVTLNTLLPSGSILSSGSSVVLDDPILRKFFNTEAAEGVELNVDYADYCNFVNFSSAENRLLVFREKLLQIEELDRQLNLQSSAASASLVSGSLTDVSGTAQFNTMIDAIEDRENLIRNMDGYERFLFFETGSFSGSLTGLPEDPQLVIDDVSWPKTNGVVLAVTGSASLAYFTNQTSLAADYDLSNQESLVNNTPLYLQEDADSVEYLTFLNMIGHLFDTIKLYIDAMTTIYDRDPSPVRGLSNDLVWNVGTSMGIFLPNQFAVKQLVDFAQGPATTTQDTYREAISETWKRFLHNQIYISKTKGTQQSVQALLNSYGVTPEIVRIRETVTPSSTITTSSFELFNELTNAVLFNSGASVTVPFSASGLFSPATIELRFAVSPSTGSFLPTVIMHDATIPSATLTVPVASWSIILEPTGTSTNFKGVLSILDETGTTIVSSSADRFYTGDFYTLMLRQIETGSVVEFVVKRFEDDVFEYEFSSSIGGQFTESFRSSEIILGSSGLVATSSNDIKVDEFRIWREYINDVTFDFHVQFPGMYGGNNTGSAQDNLIFRHSFGIPQDLTATSSIPNDSPFINSGTVDAVLLDATASGFATDATFPNQYKRITRQTKRLVPEAGGSQFSSNKVSIAPTASFRPDSLLITGSDVIPVLNVDKSICTTLVQRKEQVKADNTVGMYFTLAESINDSILRSVGNFNLGNLIGDPQNLLRVNYPDLIALNKFYKENYAPVFNQNDFIRLVEDLIEGASKQARELVPIQTKLLTGIVIEPTILERNRVPLNKPIVLSGAGTRNETQARTILAASGTYPDARNANALIDTVLTGSMSAESSNPSGLITNITVPITGTFTPLDTIVQEVTQTLVSENDGLETTLPTSNPVIIAVSAFNSSSIDLDTALIVLSSLDSLSTLISTSGSAQLIATVPSLNVAIDINIVDTDISAIPVSGFFSIPLIKSANDLDDPRNSTFFTHPSGSTALKGFQKIRLRENVINDKGDWIQGATYAENDVVIVSSSQFRSLTSTVLSSGGVPVNFVSFIPPNQDPANWSPVSFRTEIFPILFKAVVSGSSPIGTGSIALVPFDQPGGVFTGYSQNHYKFFRNTGIAYNRSRFVGVLQTQDTTIDGKSPIETILSSDSQLFVKDGVPRQTTKDEAGPVLEVRPTEPDE